MVNGLNLSSTAMQSLRGCRYRRLRTPRLISSSSKIDEGARASSATVTSWELNGSSIVASKGTTSNAKHAFPLVKVKNPSVSELKTLFATSALPMVGFGFMDNFIMIQAGGYIDSTLGVQFGLATLTAAAMGQVVSDVSGVLFGRTVDNAITHLGLVNPSNLSPAQRRLHLSQRVSLAGAVIGVVIGCGLGATSLCFVPNLHHNETKHGELEKMKKILSDMLGASDVECDNCTVYLAESHQLPSERIDEICGLDRKIQSSSDRRKIDIRAMLGSDESCPKQQCKRNGTTVITSNENDNSETICTPIYGKDNTFIGVLEFTIKQSYNSAGRDFGEREEKLVQVTARHISIILDHWL